ncbi:MAG TPA: nuclear transport factor 2 family protein [Candidatus Acidoferrales bacterium]|jgi:ketosteroid isomerase-like protein|nr:nuclear transport factor 2 family protein [Candidatus Acidoferrales bacterium]
MKRILLATLLVACSCAAAAAQQGGDSSKTAIVDEIKKIQAQEQQAIKNRDAAALCNLLADGWAYTNQMGDTIHKAQYCSEMTDGTLRVPYITEDDVKYHVYGEKTAIVNGRSTSLMVYHGKVSMGPRRFTITFSKIGSQWKEVAHMESLITVEQ